ncbi:hypothetical protein CTAYLR_008050 [Chrysophaeum taylorii]|uniref:6-phosphofructo-2-kinase domain-containing protein n=1 Tax=Chrysophaeum taylorii TaxID=2483200 RepID=A0AAD7XIJ6_9STRA|nr:hypothetical protein CTAYLR_008050 [Chrysophaeum taylorii]
MSRVEYYENAGLQERLKDVASLSARSKLTSAPQKLVVVLVGMPARGKSVISSKLYSFLRWTGLSVRSFNVGQYRRMSATESDGRISNAHASFFADTDESNAAFREALAMHALDDLLAWLDGGGEVGLFDATNSTRKRREAILGKCRAWSGARSRGGRPALQVVFVESLCDDRVVLEANMRNKVMSSPDFRGMSFDAALEDLRERIAVYERRYETVGDDEGSYVKLFNFSSKVTAHLCFGKLSRTLVPYLMAIHSDDRPVYLTALAPQGEEPEYDQGGESDDSSLDAEFATRLSEWWWGQHRSSCALSQSDRGQSRLQILTSTLAPAINAATTIQNVRPDLVKVLHTSALNPLLLGPHQRESISAHIGTHFEDDDALPANRAFKDRSDGGESYADLVSRLEACILDIEASVDPILIITHATPARALRAYFQNIDLSQSLMGHPHSPPAKALANRQPAVLEQRAKLGGGWEEQVHVF